MYVLNVRLCLYFPFFIFREKASYPYTCSSSCCTERAVSRHCKSVWFRSKNYADYSDEHTANCRQRYLASGINTRTGIGQQKSCCERALSSMDRETTEHPVVERPCSLWARSKTKNRSFRSHQIYKSHDQQELSVFHCLTSVE